MKKKALFLLLGVTCCFGNHKIIFLISLARSASTPFLRMMRERGDFIMIHEPGVAAWGLVKSNGNQKYVRRYLPTTYEGVVNLIEEQAQKSNVFVKEMSFAATGYLTPECTLFKNPDIHFVFLIRHPHACYISNYKRIGGINGVLAEVLSYKDLFELCQRIAKHGCNKPLVIRSEMLCEDPLTTAHSFCDAVMIPFIPKSLEWENLFYHLENTTEWYDTSLCRFTEHWNSRAIKTTAFEKLPTYTCDAQGNPTFEEIANPEYRALYKKIYEENMPYYRQLCAVATQSKNTL